MIQLNTCPICDCRLEPVQPKFKDPWFIFDCLNCGKYAMAETFYYDHLHDRPYRLKPEELAIIRHYIWRHQPNNAYVVEDVIQSLFKTTKIPSALEQKNKLLLYIADQIGTVGNHFELKIEHLSAKIGSLSKETAAWVYKAVETEGLVDHSHATSSSNKITLTFAGWEMVEHLRSAQNNSKKAFMAMKFGEEELDRVFNDYLKPAAKKAGYDLEKLDESPKAGLIDDRLRNEIRTSRFVIADLTHANNGAYWEAGFCEGLGKPVIYTCKKEVFDKNETKPHFDVNHYLHIVWDTKDLESAAQQLTATIRGTLPGEAVMTDR